MRQPVTEPERDFQTKKDEVGRPPDTTKELVGKHAKSVLKQQEGSSQLILDFGTLPSAQKASKIKKVHQPPTVYPSWRWNKNSCYLDSSLELIYAAINLDLADFVVTFDNLSSENPLHHLFKCLNSRWTIEAALEFGDPQLSDQISQERDLLRNYLAEQKYISSISTPESLWVSNSRFIYT